MGAQADDLPHASIATSFTDVYYGVASRHPEQLALFYGDGSLLNHGDITADTAADIKGAVLKLPLCSGVSIFSVDSQISASGGILVQVLGALIASGKMFSQSFLLERKPDQHKLNFYCRNDIFRLLPDEDMKCIKQFKPSNPDNSLLNWNRTSPEASIPPKSGPSPTSSQIPPANASPQTVVVDSPSAKPPQQQQKPRDLQEPPQHLPKSSNVGSTVPAENGTASPIRPSTATGNKDDPPAPVQPVVDTAPPPPPKPTGPKTWASIVSKKASVQPINSVPASVVIPPTNVSSTGDTTVELPPTQLPNQNKGPSGPGGSYSNNYQPRFNKSNNNNNSSSNANPGAGKSRTFGPSAVVQLATVGSEWSGKHRELSAALSEEFSKYGYPVKHVDVKGARGIVFVEYDSVSGVEAAVAAWKNGPRGDGRFAAVALDVSEKRPARYRNSGAGRGGGNGNYYGGGGGRRHHNHHQQTRPTSTSG